MKLKFNNFTNQQPFLSFRMAIIPSTSDRMEIALYSVEEQQIPEEKELSQDELNALKSQMNEQLNQLQGEDANLMMQLRSNLDTWQRQLEIKSIQLADKEAILQQQAIFLKKETKKVKACGSLMLLFFTLWMVFLTLFVEEE